jgi:hypothetical protein
LLYGLILLAFFSPGIFGDGVYTQADHLYNFFPWRALPGGTQIGSQNPLLSDQSLGFLPFYQLIHSTLLQGDLPLWNPYSLGGTPLLGNLTAGFFYPLNWLYFLSGSPQAFAWIGFLKLWIAGTFMYLFLRQVGRGEWPSFVGGLAFMFLGFNIVWLFHPHSSVAVLLPALLYFAERWFQSGRRRDWVALAACVGLQYFGGHLESSFYVLLAVALYGAGRWMMGSYRGLSRTRFAFGLAFAVFIGTLLAAVQLGPFFEYLQHSAILVQRGAYLEATSTTFALARLEYLLPLLRPDYFGSPLSADYSGAANYNLINGAYIGGVAQVLVVFSLLHRRKDGLYWIFLGLLVFAFAMVFQVPLIFPAIANLPGFRFVNLARLYLLFGTASAVLLSYSVEWLLAMLKRPGLQASAAVLLVTLMVVQSFQFGQSYNPVVDPAIIYPATQTSDLLRSDPELFRIAAPLRVFPHETHLPYRLASVRGYDALEIRTYTELMGRLSSYEQSQHLVFPTPEFDHIELPLYDLLNVKYVLQPPGSAVLPPTFEQIPSSEADIYLNVEALPRAFLVTDYRVIPDQDERLNYLASPDFQPAQVLVLESYSGAQAAVAGSAIGQVEVLNYAAQDIELRVVSDRPAFLVLSDNYFPGWRATVAGQSVTILRANHTIRALEVPAGESVVEFEYRPTVFYISGLISLATVGLLAFSARRHWGATDVQK